MIVIVGAGAAGLALAYRLEQRRLPYHILEQNDIGATWGQHYDRLHLHTLKEVSGLPGLPMPAHYPRFPTATQFQAYLKAYATHFGLRVQCGVNVLHADSTPAGWHIHTSQGIYQASLLVVATGIWHTPCRAALPGAETFGGPILHANAYKNPLPFLGQRVLVVGVGNSGAEIAVDLGEHGVHTGIVVRDGVNLVDYPTSATAMRVLAGAFRHIPHRLGNRVLAAVRPRFDHLGLPPHPAGAMDSYPVVGYELPRAVEAGQVTVYGGIERVLPGAVRFADGQTVPFDTILLATGYRPTVDFVRDELAFSAEGFPLLDNRRSTRNPHLYCIGFEYPTTEGWLQSIERVSGEVAAALAARVGQSVNPGGGQPRADVAPR